MVKRVDCRLQPGLASRKRTSITAAEVVPESRRLRRLPVGVGDDQCLCLFAGLLRVNASASLRIRV